VYALSQFELERILVDIRGTQEKHNARLSSAESEIQRIRAKIAEVEKLASDERARRDMAMQGAASDLLQSESAFHSEQKNLYNEQKELLTKVVELERQLVAKKTTHLQAMFELENANAKAIEELKAEHTKESRDLKSQAKNDIMLLKRAYDSKKSVVQQQLDEVSTLCSQCETQLGALEPKKPHELMKSDAFDVQNLSSAGNAGGATSGSSSRTGSRHGSRTKPDEMCQQS